MSTHLNYRRLSLVVGFVAALALASTAQAVVNYGDLIGPNVMYLQVQEDPMKMPGPTPAQLFGPPALNGPNGNMLDFDPMGFEAHASDGDIAMTNSLLQTTIMAVDGNYLTEVLVGEWGGYALMGGGPDTYASSSIDMIGLKVLEINGIPVAPFNIAPLFSYANLGTAPDVVLSPFGGIKMFGDGGDHEGIWTAEAFFDLDDLGVTKAELMVNNLLKASSEVGSMAFIDKKDFYIDITHQVPEPSTIVLGGFGFIGLIAMGRKWRKSKVA